MNKRELKRIRYELKQDGCDDDFIEKINMRGWKEADTFQQLRDYMSEPDKKKRKNIEKLLRDKVKGG
jgi:hypothetical protein